MIIDSGTGEILRTKQQIIIDVKKYFNSLSNDELRARMKKEERRIKRKLRHKKQP